MGAPPETFEAAFEHPMSLTALVITPRGGDPIAVNVPAAAPSNTVSIALPALAPGNYVFAWTATGADNHTMTGRVRYMVHESERAFMRTLRDFALAALTTATLAFAPTAFAHTHVAAMSIAENATLATAPSDFTVTFSAQTGLANVALANAAGQAIALDYTPPRQMAASYTIPLPRLAPGAYTLSWRTIAHDGHAMPGQVHFTIAG
jgi:hypothetical protein